MLDEILLSKTPDTLEEEFISQQFCRCGHTMNGINSEHPYGTKCYGLIHHGCWKCCSCQQAELANFEFSFTEAELVA